MPTGRSAGIGARVRRSIRIRPKRCFFSPQRLLLTSPAHGLRSCSLLIGFASFGCSLLPTGDARSKNALPTVARGPCSAAFRRWQSHSSICTKIKSSYLFNLLRWGQKNTRLSHVMKKNVPETQKSLQVRRCGGFVLRIQRLRISTKVWLEAVAKQPPSKRE